MRTGRTVNLMSSTLKFSTFFSFLIFVIALDYNDVSLEISWFPRQYSQELLFRPGESDLTKPYTPSGPLHSLSSVRSGKIYTIGTVAFNEGSIPIFAPHDEVLKSTTSIQDTVAFQFSNSYLYSSFYLSNDIGLSWIPSSTDVPEGIVRWLSSAVLFETGKQFRARNETQKKENTSSFSSSSCTLICIMGGLMHNTNVSTATTTTTNVTTNDPSPLLPTNRVDCTNNEGKSWFSGPPLPFAVTRASSMDFGYNSIVLSGGSRTSLSSFGDVNTNGTCALETVVDPFININIWESRIIYIPDRDDPNRKQCILDMDYGWVPWNQSTPASDRLDSIISSSWSNAFDAKLADDTMHTMDVNQSWDILNSDQSNIPLPNIYVGSGEIPGTYSVPIFDLWMKIHNNESVPYNDKRISSKPWSLINRQIPSITSYEYKSAIIQEPVRLLIDLRDGSGEAILPGHVKNDLKDPITLYIESDHIFVSNNEGESFLTVFHSQFPREGSGDAILESIGRSLRRISVLRDPLHNFEPVLVGWSFTGKLWRGDFARCNDKCPTNQWSTGCMNDPYDARCNPCSVCEPGYYTMLECAMYGRYLDTYCVACSTCPEGESVLVPCSGKQNTVCGIPSATSNIYLFTVKNYFFIPSYVLTVTYIVLSFLGISMQLYYRYTNAAGDKSTSLYYLVSKRFQLVLKYWPCYSTLLSSTTHITLLVVINSSSILSVYFISLLFIFCLGLCFNGFALWYFLSYVNYFANYDHWMDKVQAIFIGILSIGHSRVLVCHDSFNASVHSFGFLRNTVALKKSFSKKLDGESLSFSSSLGILNQFYRNILWIILVSTFLSDIPFVFSLFYLTSFIVPFEFSTFLVISTIMDATNIIVTISSYVKRLDRLNLLKKLMITEQIDFSDKGLNEIKNSLHDDNNHHLNINTTTTNNNHRSNNLSRNSKSPIDTSTTIITGSQPTNTLPSRSSHVIIQNGSGINVLNDVSTTDESNRPTVGPVLVSATETNLSTTTSVVRNPFSIVSGTSSASSPHIVLTDIPRNFVSADTRRDEISTRRTSFAFASSEYSNIHNNNNDDDDYQVSSSLPLPPTTTNTSSVTTTTNQNNELIEFLRSAFTSTTIPVNNNHPNSLSPVQSDRDLTNRIQRCIMLASETHAPSSETSETVDHLPIGFGGGGDPVFTSEGSISGDPRV